MALQYYRISLNCTAFGCSIIVLQHIGFLNGPQYGVGHPDVIFVQKKFSKLGETWTKSPPERADNLFLLLGAWRLSVHLLEVCIHNISKFWYLGVSLALIKDFTPYSFVNKKEL